MQFSISAAILSLALATLCSAAPTATPSSIDIVERDPKHHTKPYDWYKNWDGEVTPIEEIGEDVTVSYL